MIDLSPYPEIEQARAILVAAEIHCRAEVHKLKARNGDNWRTYAPRTLIDLWDAIEKAGEK